MDSESNAQSEPSAQTSPGWLTWDKCYLFVILVMVLGPMILGLPRVLWLAPPLVQYTTLVYWMPALAWLPVLIICALLRPTGGFKLSSLLLLVVLGLVQIIVVLTLLGPQFLSAWCNFDLSCQRQQLSTFRVRYTCVSDSSYCYDTYYVLEGPTNSPVLWLVEEGR
jgi:hypothetical protein